MTRKTRIVVGGTALAVAAAGVIWASIGRSTTNRQRLVGTWRFVSGENDWAGPIITFAGDGTVKTTSWSADPAPEVEGTYEVKGDTIELILAGDVEPSEKEAPARGDRARKSGGGMGTRPNTDPKARPQMPSRQQTEPTLHRLTIRSLSATELMVADERGQKTIYARK